MTHDELASCINTVELFRRRELNMRGMIDVVDSMNCDKIIEMLINYPHWIPCSERLPEEDNVEVLCTVKQQIKTDRSETIIVEQGCYFYGTWLLSYDNKRVNCSREVLAWQPLPSPYQEEGEEDA